MPKRLVVDNKALIKMVDDGATQAEIIKAFGFKTPQQFSNAHYRAMQAEGLVPKVKGAGRARKEKSISNVVEVKGRGNLVIPAKLVDFLGFAEGSRFEASRTEQGLLLKKV